MSQALKEHSLQTYIPPTRKLNMRSDRSRVNECEACGYRPLCHIWKLLSPHEFWRYWRVVPLLVPTYYKNRGETARTKWTSEGLCFIKSQEYKDGTVAAKPGVHFQAIPSPTNEYFLFPEEPQHIYATYRHAWALVRKTRPDVVVIEGLKLPNPAKV